MCNRSTEIDLLKYEIHIRYMIVYDSISIVPKIQRNFFFNSIAPSEKRAFCIYCTLSRQNCCNHELCGCRYRICLSILDTQSTCVDCPLISNHGQMFFFSKKKYLIHKMFNFLAKFPPIFFAQMYNL